MIYNYDILSQKRHIDNINIPVSFRIPFSFRGCKSTYSVNDLILLREILNNTDSLLTFHGIFEKNYKIQEQLIIQNELCNAIKADHHQLGQREQFYKSRNELFENATNFLNKTENIFKNTDDINNYILIRIIKYFQKYSVKT